MHGNVPFHIKPGDPALAAQFTTLVRAAKAHWGYPEEWMQTWQTDLTVLPEEVEKELFFYVEQEGRICGLYGLFTSSEEDEIELEHLWIEPEFIGNGLGGKLFHHALQTAREQQAKQIRILSDPHAEAFYLHMGAKREGEKPSAIPGRVLPILRYYLAE